MPRSALAADAPFVSQPGRLPLAVNRALPAVGVLIAGLITVGQAQSRASEGLLTPLDSALIYIGAAEFLADSLSAWYPGRRIQLAIPDFPLDSALKARLISATTRTAFVLMCPDLVRCTKKHLEVVRLYQLQPLQAGTVQLRSDVPTEGWLGGEQPPGAGWSWAEWGMAASNGLFLDMRRYVTGGCSGPPRPYMLLLHPTSHGWSVVRTVMSLRLCA